MKETKKIDIKYLIENADFHDLSADHKWSLWACKNIVFIKVSGFWSIDEIDIYMNRFWSVFLDLRKKWNKVYFLIDTNDMELQTEKFRHYMKEQWAHLLDQEDLSLCLIDKKSMKRLLWKSIYRLLGIADKIQLFMNHDQASVWLQKQSFYEMKLGVKTENPKKQTPIKLAQQFIQDQLLSLSEHANIKIDDLVWNQRVNDWQAEIQYLAVYVRDKRFTLPYSNIELLHDQDTENWKRMIIDKLNWFLTEDILKERPNRYQYLKAGKLWVEDQLRVIEKKINKYREVSIKASEWRNPDQWRYDRLLKHNIVGFTIWAGDRKIELIFPEEDLKNCAKSRDMQDKISKYLEAKLILEQ
jgi:hypothetical protein